MEKARKSYSHSIKYLNHKQQSLKDNTIPLLFNLYSEPTLIHFRIYHPVSPKNNIRFSFFNNHTSLYDSETFKNSSVAVSKNTHYLPRHLNTQNTIVEPNKYAHGSTERNIDTSEQHNSNSKRDNNYTKQVTDTTKHHIGIPRYTYGFSEQSSANPKHNIVNSKYNNDIIKCDAAIAKYHFTPLKYNISPANCLSLASFFYIKDSSNRIETNKNSKECFILKIHFLKNSIHLLFNHLNYPKNKITSDYNSQPSSNCIYIFSCAAPTPQFCTIIFFNTSN